MNLNNLKKQGQITQNSMPIDTNESNDDKSVPFPFLKRKYKQQQTQQQNFMSEDLRSPSNRTKLGPMMTQGHNSIIPYKTQSVNQPSPSAAGSLIAPASLTLSKKPQVRNLFTLFNQ